MEEESKIKAAVTVSAKLKIPKFQITDTVRGALSAPDTEPMETVTSDDSVALKEVGK